MAKAKTINADYSFHAATDTFAAAAVIRDARAIFGARLKIDWENPDNWEVEGIPELNENRLADEIIGQIEWAVRRLSEAADKPGVAIDLKAGTVTYSVSVRCRRGFRCFRPASSRA